MNTKLFITLALSTLLVSCKVSNSDNLKLSETDSERIAIDETIKGDKEIEEFIAPFKEHLNATLDSVIAFNPKLLSKNDGDLNTAIGNLMADIVMIQANPVIKKRTGKDIDMVLLNKGGIRSELPEGGVTARSAYNLMPFENEIVVAELSGKQIKKMLKYLEKAKSAHPVSGIKIVADKNYKTIKATIQGKEIDENETYLVATSDYLLNGGDNMNFFKDPVNIYGADYKIRNALIDYFTKVDTIKAEIDDRYIRE
ncbi:5'-nucleotidase [Christiangramia gaetbulicola]|uniref:5'-nucleotidase n=1 Tax=Christiangramia gaetbulicola TaxID=703340 RepID=A0A2T6AIV8_9FLAO|nr:5'-nucleotidase [Christiangramia gaetbulicola]PTX43758.1 5'-nucleotidase [Christiangramia gaetbulicola]